jgi:hypothetical protein
LGTSTDAIIYFGVDLGEDLSIFHPDHLYDEHDALVGLEAMELINKKIKKYRMMIVWHCSYEVPMFIIGFAPSYKCAFRGSPNQLDSLNMMHDMEDEGRKAFNEFLDNEHEICKQINISRNDEMSWLLFSKWN